MTHQVSDYILLTFIWEFLNVFLHGMPIVSDLQLPKQNKADIRTTKLKSIKCSHQPDGSPCIEVSCDRITYVAHLDFVADDGCVVEPGRGLPGEEDVGVGHGLHRGRVGRVGDVPEHNSARGLALAQGVPSNHLKSEGEEDDN